MRSLGKRGATQFNPCQSHPAVQVFFKRHPRRDEIGVSDKIEILQLETRGRFLEQEVLKCFKRHAQRLQQELEVTELLPRLQKQHVLTADEAEELSKENVKQQSQMLLKFVGEKTPFWVVRFAECLRESPGNKQLSELLLPGKVVQLPIVWEAWGIILYFASRLDISRENRDPVQHKKGNLRCQAELNQLTCDYAFLNGNTKATNFSHSS